TIDNKQLIMKSFSFDTRKFVTFGLIIVLAAIGSYSQKPGDGTPLQRLDVMRPKLETVRRSLTSVLSVLKDEGKDEKDAKENPD
ncbi:hypothetical protein OFM36_36255, partial [Escherichia coli]|nr:hypothetical protein [Escherichia coli]